MMVYLLVPFYVKTFCFLCFNTKACCSSDNTGGKMVLYKLYINWHLLSYLLIDNRDEKEMYILHSGSKTLTEMKSNFSKSLMVKTIGALAKYFWIQLSRKTRCDNYDIKAQCPSRNIWTGAFQLN